MANPRNRRIIGIGLIAIGALFLLVSNHVLLGWEHVWPLFLLMGGALFIRIFMSRRSPEMLFAGVNAALIGVFLLLFSAGVLEWDKMAVLWPTIPLIAGIALLAVSTVSEHGGTAVIVGSTIILFTAVSFLLEAGTVNPRVAAPFIRFWPLVLVVAGIVILKTRTKETDPDMEAVRDVIGTLERDTGFENSDLDPTVEQAILEPVKAAPDPDHAVASLVQGIKNRFSRFSWVGVYRVAGDKLTLGETDYVGAPPEYREIKLDEGICGAAATSGLTIVVPDVCNDERYLACSPTVKSEIVVPVKVDNSLIGVLDVDSDELDAFSTEDRHLLESIARQAAPFLKVGLHST